MHSGPYAHSRSRRSPFCADNRPLLPFHSLRTGFSSQRWFKSYDAGGVTKVCGSPNFLRSNWPSFSFFILPPSLILTPVTLARLSVPSTTLFFELSPYALYAIHIHELASSSHESTPPPSLDVCLYFVFTSLFLL